MNPQASASELRQRLNALRTEQPNLRARREAQALGVSEAELVQCQQGDTSTRLGGEPEQILAAVTELGKVMALTRNEYCVHERKGIYNNLHFSGPSERRMGLAVNPDIDLRLFLHHWASAFAVSENGRHSLQFFDGQGDAVHKIYLTDESNTTAYEPLISRFAPLAPATLFRPQPAPVITSQADSAIDHAGLAQAWRALKDTHEFHPLLRRFDVQRLQALRLAPRDLAYPVETDAPQQVLKKAANSGLEIMVFVGNRGCIQIHTGPVNQLMARGPWFNVLDPDFNLHLDETAIASCWVTRKPSVDGDITAVELYAADDTLIAQFFGKRKPGQPELPEWRELVSSLPPQEVAHAS